MPTNNYTRTMDGQPLFYQLARIEGAAKPEKIAVFGSWNAALNHIERQGYTIAAFEEDDAHKHHYDVVAARAGTADQFTIEPCRA